LLKFYVRLNSFQQLTSTRMRCINIYATFSSQTINYSIVEENLYYNKCVLGISKRRCVLFKYTPDGYNPSHAVLYSHVRPLKKSAIKNSLITNSVITKSWFRGPFEFVITRSRYFKLITVFQILFSSLFTTAGHGKSMESQTVTLAPPSGSAARTSDSLPCNESVSSGRCRKMVPKERFGNPQF